MRFEDLNWCRRCCRRSPNAAMPNPRRSRRRRSRCCSRAVTSSRRRRPEPARPRRSSCPRCSDSPRRDRARRRSDVVSACPRVLVLAPTRELAQQVATQSARYGQNLRLRTVCVFGGAPYPPQNRELERGVDVLVATPGRLMDHIERGRVDLSQLQVLVLDEADRMLDMGFSEDVDRICALAPADAADRALLGDVRRRHRPAGRAPDARRRCASTCAPSGSSPVAIEQRVHFADDRAHKYRLLDRLLADVGAGQSIIFMATKRDAEALAIKLQDEGHTAAALHGDMHQRERDRTLTRLRRGGVRTLVATDVAARGIDVPGCYASDQFRPAAPGRELRAPDRPHRARRRGRHRRVARQSDGARHAAVDRALYGRGDPGARHSGPRAARAQPERGVAATAARRYDGRQGRQGALSHRTLTRGGPRCTRSWSKRD